MILEQIKNSKEPNIIGLDECGTGAFAGRIYVSAVKVPKNWTILKLNDSKKLSPKVREELFKTLIEDSNVSYSIVYCEANKLDNYLQNGTNLVAVLKILYAEALSKLNTSNSLIILDGNHKIPNIEHFSLPKADSLIPAVSAASILAKVSRDAHMIEMSKVYPNYGFDSHKGYGVFSHKEALNKYGISAIHRRSYKPIKEMLEK